MTIEAGVGTSDHHNPNVRMHHVRVPTLWGEIGPVAMHNDRHLITSVVLG